MNITFTSLYVVKDGSGTTYKPGDTLECSQASADHFINRGAAVETSTIQQTEQKQATVKQKVKAAQKDAETVKSDAT